jgi:hypothetical protein
VIVLFFLTWHGFSRLKTWTRQEGAVRLSEDDGPPAHTFLGEDDDELEEEDSESGSDDDIRQERTTRVPDVELQTVGVPRADAPSLLVNEDAPPPPQGRN